jgi:hypothetical protein
MRLPACSPPIVASSRIEAGGQADDSVVAAPGLLEAANLAGDRVGQAHGAVLAGAAPQREDSLLGGVDDLLGAQRSRHGSHAWRTRAGRAPALPSVRRGE